MRRITGCKTTSQQGEDNKNRMNDLSLFLNWFIVETRPAASTIPADWSNEIPAQTMWLIRLPLPHRLPHQGSPLQLQFCLLHEGQEGSLGGERGTVGSRRWEEFQQTQLRVLYWQQIGLVWEVWEVRKRCRWNVSEMCANGDSHVGGQSEQYFTQNWNETVLNLQAGHDLDLYDYLRAGPRFPEKRDM